MEYKLRPTCMATRLLSRLRIQLSQIIAIPSGVGLAASNIDSLAICLAFYSLSSFPSSLTLPPSFSCSHFLNHSSSILRRLMGKTYRKTRPESQWKRKYLSTWTLYVFITRQVETPNTRVLKTTEMRLMRARQQRQHNIPGNSRVPRLENGNQRLKTSD